MSSNRSLAKTSLTGAENLVRVGFRTRFLYEYRKLVITLIRPGEYTGMFPKDMINEVILDNVTDAEVAAVRHLLDAICHCLNVGMDPRRIATMCAKSVAFGADNLDVLSHPLTALGMHVVRYPCVAYRWFHEPTATVVNVYPDEKVELDSGRPPTEKNHAAANEFWGG